MTTLMKGAMRLSDAIEHTELSKAKLVAGADAMSREMMWVHIVDHPEICNWVKPGELLLTTGYNWPECDDESRELVKQLSKIGLAGVVMAVPHFREHFSSATIEEANFCQLPLLELPWGIQFSDIMHDVLARIIVVQAEVIRRSDLIHRTLTEAALEVNNLAGLARALHASLEKRAVVVSIEGDLLGASGGPVSEDDERRFIRMIDARKASELFGENISSPLTVSDRPNERRVGGVVRLRGEIVAVIWLVSETGDFSELDIRALEHAVVIAALHLTYQRQLTDQETRLGYAFVDGLLEGNFSATPSAVERAQSSGWSETRDYRVCLVLLNEPIPLSGEGLDRRSKMADRVSTKLRCLNVVPLISVSSNHVSFLLPSEVSPNMVWRSVRIEGCAMAVSRIHQGVAGMALGAEDVVALIPYLKPGCIHDFEEVLFPRALMGDADARVLLLKKLIDPLKNPRRGNSLVDTVLCLANEGFQLLNTSRALNIHISTLRYRIERIEKLLKISLDNPDDRFRLQVAAQMHSLVSEAF